MKSTTNYGIDGIIMKCYHVEEEGVSLTDCRHANAGPTWINNERHEMLPKCYRKWNKNEPADVCLTCSRLLLLLLRLLLSAFWRHLSLRDFRRSVTDLVFYFLLCSLFFFLIKIRLILLIWVVKLVYWKKKMIQRKLAMIISFSWV